MAINRRWGSIEPLNRDRAFLRRLQFSGEQLAFDRFIGRELGHLDALRVHEFAVDRPLVNDGKFALLWSAGPLMRSSSISYSTGSIREAFSPVSGSGSKGGSNQLRKTVPT
jgi:hypothetical protein